MTKEDKIYVSCVIHTLVLFIDKVEWDKVLVDALLVINILL